MLSKIFQVFTVLALTLVTFSVLYYHQRPLHLSISAAKSTFSAYEVLFTKAALQQDFKSSDQGRKIINGEIIDLPWNEKEEIRVGIIGESWSTRTGDSFFNRLILKQLLEDLKQRQVNLIFFNGNLVSGIVQSNNEKSNQTADLKMQLEAFSSFVMEVLGPHIPFFAAIGSNEVESQKNALEIFRTLFNTNHPRIFENGTFGYGVSIGEAFFVVIPTDVYEEKTKSSRVTFSHDMQAWLKQVLFNETKRHRYLFVLGHQPAYSHHSTFYDTETKDRDAFWNLLVESKVLAYFASHEHLFDRSNRHGVWQIISGGGGAPISEGGGDQPFFHCLLLTIPSDDRNVPRLEILDLKGESIESFELKSLQSPIYQLHIS